MKLKSLVFPYRSDALGNYFPILPVTLHQNTVKKEFFALIDSGATISVFRPEVAEGLNITIPTGEEIFLGGIAGRIQGFIHTISLSIGNKKFRCPVVFSEEYSVSFNLLGRESFFDHFHICFDDKKKVVEVS